MYKIVPEHAKTPLIFAALVLIYGALLVGGFLWLYDLTTAPKQEDVPTFRDYYTKEELEERTRNIDKTELNYFLEYKDTFFPVGFVRVMDDGIVILADIADKKYAKRVSEYVCSVSRTRYPGAGVKKVKVYLDNPAIDKPYYEHDCYTSDVK